MAYVRNQKAEKIGLHQGELEMFFSYVAGAGAQNPPACHQNETSWTGPERRRQRLLNRQLLHCLRRSRLSIRAIRMSRLNGLGK